MFKDSLRYLREHQELSQAEVFRRIGIFASSYSRYGCGTNEPNLETLKKLAALFDCTVLLIIFLKLIELPPTLIKLLTSTILFPMTSLPLILVFLMTKTVKLSMLLLIPYLKIKVFILRKQKHHRFYYSGAFLCVNIFAAEFPLPMFLLMLPIIPAYALSNILFSYDPILSNMFLPLLPPVAFYFL